MVTESGTSLTHIDETGKARMVDVSGKGKLLRTARATGTIWLEPTTVALIKSNQVQKGDVLSTAKIAGIMAAKRTSELIPLCHNIEIDLVDIEFAVHEDRIEISSVAKCVDKTGIEMEALTAVSLCALTIWDMCKAVDKTMRIGEVRLLGKTKEAWGENHG